MNFQFKIFPIGWKGGGDYKNGKVLTLSARFGLEEAGVGKGRKGEGFGDGEFSPNCAKLSKLRRKWAERLKGLALLECSNYITIII